jgi:hypothetical protein
MKKRMALVISLAAAFCANSSWALDGEFEGGFRSQLVVTKCGSEVETYSGYLDLNDDGTWALYDELSSSHDDDDDDLELLDDNGLDNDDDLNDDDLPILKGTFNANKNSGPINLIVDSASRDLFEDELEDSSGSRCGDETVVTTNMVKQSKLRVVVNKRGDRLRYDEQNHSVVTDDQGKKHNVKYKSKATLVKKVTT